jgi:hypothetical protein
MDLVAVENRIRGAYIRGGVVAVIAAAANYGLQYRQAQQFARDVVAVARGVDRAGRDLGQVIRDNFRSGVTVSRFQQNIGTVDPSAPVKKRRGSGLTSDIQPKKLFSMKRKGVPNVIPGGIGHYQGDFRKQRTDVSESKLTQYGYIREREGYGELNSSDVQYFGVQSVNVLMAIRPICAAFLRMVMWRHFRITYASESDLVYEGLGAQASEVKNLLYYYRSKESAGVFSGGSVAGVNISATTVFGDLVTNLEGILLSNPAFGLVNGGGGAVEVKSRFSGYQIQYQAATVGANLHRSVVYNIEQQMVSLNIFTVIHLQNVTRSNYADARTIRDDIGANPLVGKCFTLNGRYPVVEDTGSTGWSRYLQFSDLSGFNGIIIPSVVPTGEFRAVPNPQIFSNIIKCDVGLRLEPGDIKKDVIRFSYRGKFCDLMEGLSVQNIVSGGVIEEGSYDRAGMFGITKLYAFEKVMPTGPDTVEMSYHLDRYENCLFSETYFGNSVRSEFAQSRVDRVLIPEPLAMVAPVNEGGDEVLKNE